MFTTIVSNVAFGWLLRRLAEVGSFIAGFSALVLYAPPDVQASIVALLTGQGGGLSIMAWAALGGWVWSQIKSWQATTKPQIVDGQGNKLTLPQITKEEAMEAAKAATGVDHVFVGKR